MALVAKSQVFLDLLATLRKAARAPFPLVLTGPTGVGKTALCHFVHQHSDRANQPFLSVDCARLRGPLLEADLLGVRKGAATGVLESPGRFVEANRGILVLENLDLLAPEDQSVFLRVLETGLVQPVGGGPERSINVRVLVTAQTPLEELVANGRLREDLYYRLSVLELHVPSLADRPADRLPLFETAAGMPLDDAAAAAVSGYSWPGNLWQLNNCASLAAMNASGKRITLTDLPALDPLEPVSATAMHPGSPENIIFEPVPLELVEKQHILATLAHFKGNRSRTAESLGISRKSLWQRLKRWRQEEKP